jgi:hypothetical protein
MPVRVFRDIKTKELFYKDMPINELMILDPEILENILINGSEDSFTVINGEN